MLIFLVGYLFSLLKRAGQLERDLVQDHSKMEGLANKVQEQEKSLSDTDVKLNQLREENTESKVQYQKAISLLEAKEEQVDELNNRLFSMNKEVRELRDQIENARLKGEQQEATIRIEQNRLEIEKEAMQRQKYEFTQQSAHLKDEFKALSADILKQRQEEFSDANKKGLDSVINPLKEVLGTFRKRVDEVHTEQTRGQGQLENELKSLKSLNSQLSERAENLSMALRNDKKTLGNWGEVQLERLLENSGLDKNCYRRETNFKNFDGANQRTDFIIDLPEDKCLIIDSKVSLNAYIDAVNASSKEESLAKMKMHTTNVRNHIKDLAEKDYDSIEDINSPDFVFMFMPNESAYLAAFEEDASLFDFAYEKKVAVVTPNTLLPILRTVSSLWRIEKQNKSTLALSLSAEKVHKKLATFIEKFERVETQLTTVQRSLTEAKTTLSGRGSLLGLVKDFEEKGVKVAKALPETSEME